jgi:hypothetical protein
MRSSFLVTVAVSFALPAQAALVGPGLGNVTYSAEQVFAPVGFIQSPEGHGNVALVQGHLMVIDSSDGGGDFDDGAIEFWDVSDPTTPVSVARYDNDDTHLLREAHGYTLAWMNGALVLCAQAEEGVVFFDVTDVNDVFKVGFIDLPGITKGDYSGDWWTFFQAPHVFVAGVDSGLYVVDAHDVAAPTLVAQVPTGALAGVSPAQVFATGNLLVVMEAQGRGYATLDISDPTRPRLLRQHDGNSGYSNIFAGPGLILTSGNIPPRVTVTQVSASGAMSAVRTFGFVANSGGYGSYQDGFFHTGFSDRYVKADVDAGAFVGDGSSGRADRDEDFATVLGNLVFAGNDHGNGSALIAHQAAPDTTPPTVEWVHPPDGAQNVALTTRVGFSFSDHIRSDSLDDVTVQVFDAEGARVPVVLSAQLGLVNAAPAAALAPNTTYRVVVEGVADIVGNGSARQEFTFTTGSGAVAADPATVVVDVDNNSVFGAYSVASFREGAAPYVDRDFAIAAGFPSRLDGAALLQTRNNDKLSRSDDFLRFTLPRAATLHVLYDVRAAAPPTWLTSTFAATGETVTTDDTTYNVWQREAPAGPVVLGGNAAAGSADVESMYSVVVVRAPLSCALDLGVAAVGAVNVDVDVPADSVVDIAVNGASVDVVRVGGSARAVVDLAAGRHSVVVGVSRDGESATCSGVQVVARPAAAQPSSTSETVVFRGGRAIALAPDHGAVVAVDVANGARLWSAGGFVRPVALAAATGGVWVADAGGDRVVFVDDNGAVGRSVATGAGTAPAGVAVVVDGGQEHVYATLAATGEVVHRAPDGSVRRAFVVDSAGGLAAFGDRLFVSRTKSVGDAGAIVVVDRALLTVRSTIALAFDAGPDTEASGRGVLTQLSSLRIAKDGTRAFVSGVKANTARGAFRDGQALTFESRTRAFVATIDLDAEQELVALRMDINDREGVQGLALSPAADIVFVAARGNDVVDVFDVNTGKRVSQFAVGAAPIGVALGDTDAGGVLAVNAYLGRSVGVVDVSALVAGVDSHAGARVDVAVADVEVVDDVVLRGKRLFFSAERRISKDGYIACASCHPDGGEDGLVWDFTQAGEGLRNTIALVGRSGTGHGRVHWSANFDEIQDFEGDIRNGFGGTGLMSDADFDATRDPLGAPKAGRSADLDALAAYVTSLSRVPPSPFGRGADGAVDDAVRAGRVVYVDAGCVDCHSGAAFSDFARHDVGTIADGSGLGIGAPLGGVGFDTPTLRGVVHTAPYFHDGSAASLDDVVTRHAPALADPDRAALVAYLRALDERSLPADGPCVVDAVSECVDDGEEGEGEEGEGEGEEGEGEGEEGVDEGCGCNGNGAGAAVALLALLRRRRRLR